MMKRNGLRVALVAALLASVSLPSNIAYSQSVPDPTGGLMDAAGGLFGGGKATKAEQLAQIALAETQLEGLLQAVESLQLGPELVQALEQMLGVQGIVEDVMAYEVPSDLVQEYDIISPFEHARLTTERTQYMKEIDAEIASLEADIALNPSQFETLQMAMGAIAEPRSDIVATQAQSIGDMSQLEQDRRKMAVELLRNKRADIMRRLEDAHNNSEKAALACLDAPVDVKC